MSDHTHVLPRSVLVQFHPELALNVVHSSRYGTAFRRPIHEVSEHLVENLSRLEKSRPLVLGDQHRPQELPDREIVVLAGER